jgi:hypothetical protein
MFFWRVHDFSSIATHKYNGRWQSEGLNSESVYDNGAVLEKHAHSTHT